MVLVAVWHLTFASNKNFIQPQGQQLYKANFAISDPIVLFPVTSGTA
jgi:hypothetical protein